MTHLQNCSALLLLMHYQVITHTHSAWPPSLLLRKCKASELKVVWDRRLQRCGMSKESAGAERCPSLGTLCCRPQPQSPSSVLLLCLLLEVGVAHARSMVQNRNTKYLLLLGGESKVRGICCGRGPTENCVRKFLLSCHLLQEK